MVCFWYVSVNTLRKGDDDDDDDYANNNNEAIKEAHSIDVAIPNSLTFHSIITEKLQKCTD
jgi:hypothetical protein